ncbi:dynamin family protein [Desmospora profundinema]|uniref:GTPase n=1 Tax=Desmospora profundinema TaxID=1571184 RepID=A0ABU1IIN5_9BACL|nr:dynamin family protein [Desmospora profundinema]MDR6224622.1 putative GTPase [Desmospora profundinema]
MLVTTPEILTRSLMLVSDAMKQNGDPERARRMADLARKAHRQSFTLALCGHFSAGKSSMLNAILGRELLPTSPIPTSANVVRIRRGEDRVRLTLSSGAARSFSGAYTEAELKALCKNGEEVIAVEVDRSDLPLPSGVDLLDTPGIDSTDDAHRMATESALHLADVIFYVMDYNHVQSELNLQFLRELSKRGKRLYLVVNQVDKHRETELPFREYRRRVEETFRQWELQVENVFYTTLLQPDHPLNEWGQLQATLDRLLNRRETWGKESVEREASFLVEEHLAWREQDRLDAVQAWIAETGGSLPDRKRAQEEEQQLREEYDTLSRERQSIRTRYSERLVAVTEHAHLTPFAMREAARSYLETQLTPFRVGILFSRSKTEREKERRFQALWEPLREAIATQLDIPVRQQVIRFLKEERVYTDTIGTRIQEAAPPVHSDLLFATIKKGAGLTGDYILKYCDDLAQAIKRAYRQWAEQWWDEVQDTWSASRENRLSEIDARLHHLDRVAKVRERIRVSEQQAAHSRDEFQGFLARTREGIWKHEWTEWLENESPTALVDSLSSWTPSTVTEAAPLDDTASRQESPTGDGGTELVLAHVRRAEERMADLPGVETIRQQLLAKKQRLEQRRYTVALFGAFSAGKSSFVNALIGEAALPVSPNPTTAAINRITAPADGYRHGDVVIQYKDEQTLWQDLRSIYALFRQQVESMEEALAGIDGLLATRSPHPRQQAAFPFLRAVRDGWDTFSKRLGTTEAVGREGFAEAVASEETACFVEWAKLYHDNPLTRAGVTLVDTPGADSVHARHTEVAFRYIKDADAILFVTYYNHAFSRADREFLIQLGRVKDTFAMDKMFFLMNAADLAASEEECGEVESYLKQQLITFGIRKPRLFPVSSLKALEEKQAGKTGGGSGLSRFEQAFTRFLTRDLAQVTLHGMKQDIQHARRMLLRQVEAARQGNEAREQQRTALASEKKTLLSMVERLDSRMDDHALRQEVKELFYYIRQRLFLRYPEVFAEIFNPGALREDRGSVHEQLRVCALELLDFLRHDLAQELRATGLRVENWLSQRLDSRHRSLEAEANGIHPDLPLPAATDWKWETLHVDPPFPDLGLDELKPALSHFKGTKHFFAKNGRAQVREQMQAILEEAVTAVLAEEQTRFLDGYTHQWQQAFTAWKHRTVTDIDHHFAQLAAIMEEPADPAPLEKAAEALRQELQGMEQKLGEES